MLSFDEIRKQYPDASELSDNEIISRIAKSANLPIEQVAWGFGIDNAAKAPRSALEVANDTVVNFGNAAIGGVKAAIDFVSPGSRVSDALEGVMESGNRTKSLSTRIADERLGQALSSDELGPQASGVVDYVLQNPLQAAATAAGSFVGPGFAIKGARGGAALLGATEKGVQRAGTRAAMTTGGMMAGGDAAGDAYDTVYARTGDAELATKAAREASVVPALIGAIGGRFGAEGALAKGGTKSILKTGAAEFGTEFVEEGSTKLSANLAAGQYVDGINPMTGVAGSALMGGILGGGTGLAVGALTKERSILPGANTRDVGGDLSTGGKTDGSGISTAINNTDPQGQQFLFGPEQMPDVQGTPRNPYDVGGQVSAFQNNVDTTLGTPQTSLFGTSPEMQSAQIAQENQQQQQVQQQQQQQAQEQQANEARFNALQLFGILNDPNSQRGMFFGNPIIGAPRLTAIADALNNVLPNIPQGQLPIIQALVKANEATGGSLVKLSFKADKIEKSVMGGINALANAMQRYQIDQAQTVEEAAEILNTLSQTAKGKQLDEINAIHEQLTGKDTVGYTQSQGAKDGQLQVQGNAGVRAVPERGSATGTDAAGLGLLQPQQVQSVQPGSVAGGQNGQQNVAAGDQGTPARAAGTVPGGVAQNASPQVGVTNGTGQPATAGQSAVLAGQPAPTIQTVAPGQPVARGAGDVQTRGADGRNVDAQAATGLAPEVSAAEETRTRAENLIDAVLDLVIRRQGRMSAKVFPAYKTFLKMHFGGVKNADLLPNIAEYLSTPEAPVSLDMVKKWNGKAKTFLQDNLGALRAAVDQIATQNDMSIDELLDEINTRIADMETQQPTEYDSRVEDLEPVSKEEALGGEIDQRDLSGDTGLTESNRKSASLQEQFNGSETVNAKYLRVSEQLENIQAELDAARDEGTDTTALEAKVADLEAQLTKLIADAEKQGAKATREIRAKAGKDEAPVKADKEAPKKAETQAKADKSKKAETTEEPIGRNGTTEQLAIADRLAEGVGGDVVYQDGDLALIRGYSSLSGQPVYAGAIGDIRTRVDIEKFTGNQLSPEQKQKLIETKKRLEAQAEKQHAQNPFIKFVDGIAMSSDIPASLAGVIRGWKSLLSLGANIYVTTIDDARTNRSNFTGPHRAIGSAAVDQNERGSMRRMADGNYYIAFTKSTSITKMLEVIAHELGHVHQREVYENAPAETKAALKAEFEKWLAQQKGKTGRELIESLRARTTGRTTTAQEGVSAEQMSPYWRSFNEWYADQVSRWAVASSKPQTVVEKFFSKLAIALRQFYSSLKAEKYLPNETFKQYLERLSPTINESQSETEVDTYSTVDPAEQAWDKVASTIPGAPLFAELSQADRETFTEFGPENWTREDVITQLQRLKPEMSTSKGAGKGSDAQAVRDEIQSFIGTENRQKLVVLQSIKDIPAVVQYLLRMAQSKIDGKTQAFVIGGRAYLIADNIAPGKARAIFMHEVGSHLGLQTMLSEAQFDRLVDQILDWAGKNDGTQEHDLAVRAMKRVKAAKTSAESYNNELLAYFIEEATLAGVNPTATQSKTGAAQWLKTVFTAFKNALTKLGFKNMNLTTQDIVDMAFGAARIEMTDALNDSRPARKQPAVEFSKSASINDLRSGAMDTIGRLPKPYQGAVRQIFDTIKNFGKEGLVRAAFTEDLVNMAKNLVPSAKKWWDLTRERVAIKTKFERRVEEILQEYDRLDGSVKGTGPNSVNKFLKDSTMEGKWGFQPSWVQNATVDPDMKARFDAMPAAAQAVIKRVFEHGYETLVEMKKGVMDNITTEYDALIAAAQQSGDAKELALLQKKKAESLRNYQSLMSIQANTPYAPLKRFGNHVVVGRSQAYLDAVQTLEDPNATEDQRAEARSQLREYQKDESHYFVQFAETRAEAMSIVRQQEQNYALVQNFKKDDVREQLYGGRDIQGLFYRLRNLVSESMESNNLSAGEKAINRLVNDLHLSMLSEQSARQSERRRKKIAGADDDMMRAFATQGRATAHFISTLQNTGGIYESLQAMKREADQRTPGREERRQYYNEFIKRHAMGLEYEPHPIIDRAMGATSVWMLLTNPAYYLQNATQPFMMTLPTLAGKHGYGRSQAAMFKAYRELMGVLRKDGLSESSYAKLPADVRNAIERLVNAGRIDISLDQDLGRWRSSEERNAASFAIEKLRGIAQDVESINRVVSAVAAYRLERQSGSSEEKSIAYADKVIYDTHGDYSGANAPRVTRSGVGRMVTQFRKFQLIQLSLMTKLTHQAFKGASAEERMIGRKALAYTLTHLFAMTGLVGMPGFSAIAWALGAAFGDEDEPNNPEAKLRKAIGNDALADLLLKGVPKLGGVDLSGKIGAGTMLSLMPYTDVDLSRDGYARAVVGLLGPFAGGLVPKAVDGVGLMASGDYYKGLAAIAPTGVANAIKSYDYLNRGLTRRNGDVILSPEDVSFLDATMSALGLPTAKLTDAQFINRTQSEYEQFFKDRSTEIRRDYVEAYKKGDGEGMTEAREAWADMQESRKRNGFKVQPISELFKAPLEQRKRETAYRKTLNTTGAQAAGFQR